MVKMPGKEVVDPDYLFFYFDFMRLLKINKEKEKFWCI